MNYSLQLLAFSILNASLNDRKELSSVDILSSLYVLLAEELYQNTSNPYLFDQRIRKICSLEEPLWFIRQRYFADLYRASDVEGSATNIRRNEFYDLLISSKDITPPSKLAQALLSGIRGLDARLSEQLLDEGILL